MRLSLIIGFALAMLFQPAKPVEEKENPRLAFLLKQADSLAVSVRDAQGNPVEVKRRPQPLLHYTNPLYAEQSNGTLLLWVNGERPLFVGSYSIRSEKETFRELSLVAPVSIRCQRNGQVVWSPPATGYQSRRIPGAPVPAGSENLRLVQMRTLLRQFTVGQMRLMPTPLYRYAAAEEGVIDGALFAFTQTNDPEVIVAISAVQHGEAPAYWEYGVCRMNSSAQAVRFNNEQVWSVPGYWDHPRSADDPYVEQWDANLPAELKLVEQK